MLGTKHEIAADLLSRDYGDEEELVAYYWTKTTVRFACQDYDLTDHEVNLMLNKIEKIDLHIFGMGITQMKGIATDILNNRELYKEIDNVFYDLSNLLAENPKGTADYVRQLKEISVALASKVEKLKP